MLRVLASAAEPQKSLPALTNLPLRLVARGPAGVVEDGIGVVEVVVIGGV